MDKVTLTNSDGSSVDFFPQSYTDSAVATALAAQTPNPSVTVTDTGVTITHSDGTTQNFVSA